MKEATQRSDTKKTKQNLFLEKRKGYDFQISQVKNDSETWRFK